jgi:hypothetical protein
LPKPDKINANKSQIFEHSLKSGQGTSIQLNNVVNELIEIKAKLADMEKNQNNKTYVNGDGDTIIIKNGHKTIIRKKK